MNKSHLILRGNIQHYSEAHIHNKPIDNLIWEKFLGC